MEELEKKDVDNTIQCGLHGERHSPGAIYCICGRVLPATWTKKEQARSSGQVTNQCVRRKVCEETIFNCRHEDVNTTRTPGVRGSALFVALYACRRKGKFAVLLTSWKTEKLRQHICSGTTSKQCSSKYPKHIRLSSPA